MTITVTATGNTHSDHNRHCPQCGARAKDAWLQGRLAEVLPVPDTHLVFTLPHSLNGLNKAHLRWVIDTLFACTAQTLSQFAANPQWMGVTAGTASCVAAIFIAVGQPAHRSVVMGQVD